MVIVRNAEANRFETTIEGRLCVLEYRIRGKTLFIDHTGVPGPVGGRGIAAALTQAALDDARERGMDVVPNCEYVAVWIRRHPAYADLVRSSA